MLLRVSTFSSAQVAGSFTAFPLPSGCPAIHQLRKVFSVRAHALLFIIGHFRRSVKSTKQKGPFDIYPVPAGINHLFSLHCCGNCISACRSNCFDCIITHGNPYICCINNSFHRRYEFRHVKELPENPSALLWLQQDAQYACISFVDHAPHCLAQFFPGFIRDTGHLAGQSLLYNRINRFPEKVCFP